MRKEILFSGVSTVPPDDNVQDGELSTAMGVVPEDGALQSVLPAKVLMTLADGQKVIYIHTTSAYKHYIIYDSNDGKLYWNEDDRPTLKAIGTYNNVEEVNSLGNTLILAEYTDSTSQMDYLLWGGTEYKLLGSHIPDIGMSFGLLGHPRFYSVSDESKSTFKVTFGTKLDNNSVYNEWTEENKTLVTEQVMAKVNKFLADQSVNKGRFAQPFFIRYALRLYDGTLINHSSPILMIPSTKAPLVLWTEDNHDGVPYWESDHGSFDVMLVAADVTYRPCDLSAFEELKKWSDIVKSVDVFVSKPIYTYNQNGLCTRISNTSTFLSDFVGDFYKGGFVNNSDKATEDKLINPIAILADFPYYSEWAFSTLYKMYKANDRVLPEKAIVMPNYTNDKLREVITSESVFYRLCSIEIKDITSVDRKTISIEEDYLQSLTSREVMTDDYLTHDRVSAEHIHVYNNRVNLANAKRKLFDGYGASAYMTYNNGAVTATVSDDKTITITIGNAYVYTTDVYINENAHKYKVSKKDTMSLGAYADDSRFNGHSWGNFLFYPNVNADRLVLKPNGNGLYAIDLKPHPFLNGAYAFIDLDSLRHYSDLILDDSLDDSYDDNNIVVEPNKVYTSEVNNPFLFNVTNINTVGTGEILGISSAAKALSQGQFGQFPLYCFSTEGVWALELSTTGSYKARQPIARDVCINAKSITQIDDAVLFPTDRGIMLLSGSNIKCISDTLNGQQILDTASLPYIEEVVSKAGYEMSDIAYQTFHTFLLGCRMVYDYTHQHLIVYNPAYTYAYVYSFKTGKWGMSASNITDNVNSYPDALAMTNDNELVDYTQTDITEATNGLIITRPLELDYPNVLKTIDTVIGRGYFKKGTVQMALYGSRDLFNWFLVASSVDHVLRGFSGTPYKYFRLAIVSHLDSGESITGCTVQYELKQNNKPR